MSEETKAPADTGTTQKTALGMAEVMPKSAETSPSRQAEESAGSGATQSQSREAWLESELKKAIEARDLAKKRFLESPEGQDILTRAKKAEEYEKAQAEAEKKAAEERGEWQRLYMAEKTEREKLIQEMTETRRRSQLDHLRNDALNAYRDVNGIDSETFSLHVDKAISDGMIKVGDDGKPEGVRDFVKRLIEAKPFLFTSQAEALKRVSDGVGNTLRAASSALGQRSTDNAPRRRASLAEPNPADRSMERALAARSQTDILRKG